MLCRSPVYLRGLPTHCRTAHFTATPLPPHPVTRLVVIPRCGSRGLRFGWTFTGLVGLRVYGTHAHVFAVVGLTRCSYRLPVLQHLPGLDALRFNTRFVTRLHFTAFCIPRYGSFPFYYARLRFVPRVCVYPVAPNTRFPLFPHVAYVCTMVDSVPDALPVLLCSLRCYLRCQPTHLLQ